MAKAEAGHCSSTSGKGGCFWNWYVTAQAKKSEVQGLYAVVERERLFSVRSERM